MRRFKILLIFSLTIFFVNFLYSGTTGEISGYVTANASGEKLSGAVIVILETGREITTDNTGYFHFLGIWAKTYNLSIKLTGYNETVLKDVVVHPGVTTSLGMRIK